MTEKNSNLKTSKMCENMRFFRTKQQIRVEIFERNIFFDKMNKNVGFEQSWAKYFSLVIALYMFLYN